MSMLRTAFQRTLAARPLLSSTATPACHIARRFNSSNAKDDFAPPSTQKTHTDQLIGIISQAISVGAANASNTSMNRSGRFRKGDIYKPSDLDPSQPRNFRGPAGRNRKKVDELKIIGVNPLDEYKNPELLSHFISPVGRLLSREQTGLTAKNQRRLSKAVRRARAMCILSPTAKLH